MSSWNLLSLRPQDPEFIAAAFGKESHRYQRREGHRLDIVIDGQPLRSWVRGWEQPEWQHELPILDFVTQLSRSAPSEAKQQIDQLRGPRPGQEPATAELLYCPACFDISDGILAVEISRTEETVTWQQFGWIDENGSTVDALIPNASPFSFDASAYDHEMNKAQTALTRNWRTRFRRGPHQAGRVLMGRHGRGEGRRRATSRFRVIRVAAGVVDLCDTVIDYVAALLHPEAGSVLPLDPPFASSGASSRRMRLSWRKALRVASMRSFPEGPWTEHRIGVIVGGARANHYVAARPSSPGSYDILLSRRMNRRGHCELYKDTSQAVLEEATDLSLVAWMPVGIHADAITSTHFRRSTASTDSLTTLTM